MVAVAAVVVSALLAAADAAGNAASLTTTVFITRGRDALAVRRDRAAADAAAARCLAGVEKEVEAVAEVEVNDDGRRREEGALGDEEG